jgi:hypothetical protein
LAGGSQCWQAAFWLCPAQSFDEILVQAALIVTSRVAALLTSDINLLVIVAGSRQRLQDAFADRRSTVSKPR